MDCDEDRSYRTGKTHLERILGKLFQASMRVSLSISIHSIIAVEKSRSDTSQYFALEHVKSIGNCQGRILLHSYSWGRKP
jgi:hypothetical protein